MAGHSKWANIKHKKERADAKKGKVFSRIVKEIMSAVKQGGSDPKSNPKLRLALHKARVANLPSENIERNIKKASSSDQTDFSEMTYELYGHGGVGIVVDVMTDNRNRISSDMRIATNKKGGTIASPGSVVFNFDRKGVIQVSPEGKKEEELFIAAIDAGAEDFDLAEGVYMVITPPEKLYEVKERLDEQGIVSLETSLEMLPKHSVECSEETRAANQALLDYLENLDDVDAVFHNMAE